MGVIENKRVIQNRSRRMTRKRRKAQMILRISILSIILVGACIAFYVISFLGKTKVDLTELTTVSLSGYDGKGYATYHIEDMQGVEFFLETVTVSMSKTEDLCNGDEIRVTYSYDKDMAKEQNLRVIDTREYIKVDSLPEAREISIDELFEGVSIEYEGIAPLATATVVNNSADEILAQIPFKIVGESEDADEATVYDIGDTITVEAAVDEAELAKAGIKVVAGTNGYTKEYKVEGIPQYVSDPNELTQSQIQSMKEHAAALFTENGGDASEFGLRVFCNVGLKYNVEGTKYTFKWGGTTYISSYFNHIKKEAVKPNTTHVNDVKVVFDTSISQSDGQAVSVEAVVIYRNIVKDADGNIDVDLSTAEIVSASNKDSDIKKLVRSESDEDYEAIKYEQY